jgi:hypothetical protein
MATRTLSTASGKLKARLARMGNVTPLRFGIVLGSRPEQAFERVSDNVSLRFRETGFCGTETTRSKPARHIQLIVSRDKVPPRNPANSGLFIGDREISVCMRLRGGAERTRTSNQAVMSAVTAPKRSAIIGIFARVRRRLFLFGCGVSLVIHWLSIVKKHQRFV